MSSFAAIVFSGKTWLIPAIALLIFLAVVLVWAGHRGAVDRRIRIGCGLLKAAGILTLLLCLLDPLWTGQRARPGANFFMVVADNSQGMQVRDAGATQSRGDILRHYLTGDSADWQTKLEENFQVRRYLFDARLQGTRGYEELDFSGRASALGHSLRSGMERWHGQPVAGVLLLTDGNATDLNGELTGLDGLPPIYPVVIGRDDLIRDIAVEKVAVNQTAFEDAPVTVQVEVKANGYAGSEISARLLTIDAGLHQELTNNTENVDVSAPVPAPVKQTNLVAQQTQRATSEEARLTFRFQVQPQQSGLHFYELEVRARGELNQTTQDTQETTLANNRRMIVVDRGQEPFRILYVGGRPNWEYKFLSRALTEDPQVQLVGLIRVARREPKFEFKGRAGESSNPLFRGFDRKDEETARYDQPVLVRLNVRDEFELKGGFPKTAEELFSYHAVVVDDLEAEFFTHDQMSLLQRFVSERGGGFLMLGGQESLREGNYARTPLASLLPVYLDRPVEANLPGKFTLALTREGWLQPWTRVRATESEERTRLEKMPAFEVLNPVSEIKPGASVLATVEDSAQRTYPALIAQRFGYGRAAVLTIGDFWRWGLQDEDMQKDLAKSWRQLVRWLVADVPPRIALTAEPAPDGDPSHFRLAVKARDEEFRPLDNANVQLQVRAVHSTSVATNLDLNTNNVRIVTDSSATEPGSYESTFVARESGAYLAEAAVTQPDGKLVGRTLVGWASDPAAEEFRSLKPNRALLEALARRTGGEVLELDGLASFVSKLPERRAPITENWSYPLWHQPVVFLFVLICFVAEWGIRRWKGLP